MPNNRRVGHRQHRWRIDQHQIVILARPAQEIGKALVHQQFGRIGRYLATRHEIQIGNVGLLHRHFWRNQPGQHI
ncbi:hypothetical protein D3C72_1828600 [compost metagenome]